ncbi:MAG: fumarate reductase/succinate dehydrogenase flavoprotein subunit [Planctomycetota bacterium]
MAEYEMREHDVLVVGAGGAGLRAAIEASADGASVGLVCKSLLGKAHTVMAEGGMAAALANVRTEDNWKVHFRDTMRGGKFLSNWRMAMIHAKESADRVNELEEWGAVFDRTKDGKINQRPFGGHTYGRLAHVGDRTGLEMIRTLQDHGIHQGVEVYMECTVFHLLKDGDRIAGAVGYWRPTGEFIVFKAPAVILATGGTGKTWKITSNSWEYTGDGHALAFRAGADLIDMEFQQFHPTGMVWPPSVRGTLVTEGVRGEGGVLRNSEGKRFMFDNIPDLFKADTADTEAEAQRWVHGDRKENRRPPELLTRDVVARAIKKEVEEGRGSPHGGVFLDIASQQSADYIQRKLPSMYHQFKELANVDITKEPMEVGPTCHYAMGGVLVDAETAAATVPGLFAAGECAGGLHGANRLGGNSLSDLVVFGRRAGAGAAAYVKGLSATPGVNEAEVEEAVAWANAPLGREGPNPYEIHHELQESMQKNVAIIRVADELETAIADIRRLRDRAKDVAASGGRAYNPGWHLALDLENMLLCGEIVTRAALMREESRGAHTRGDHPQSDGDHWGKVNLVVRKRDEEIDIVETPHEDIDDPELRAYVHGDQA